MTAIGNTAPAAWPEGEEEAPFDMANLRPSVTGLPFVVFVSQRGGARHGCRIKLSPLPRFNPADAKTVTLEHPPRALEPLETADFQRVTAWIELNRDVLERYWTGAIEYTEDMLAAIKRLP